MKKILNIACLWIMLLIGCAFISSCALALHGGSLVSKEDGSIKETLVTYRAEGTVPAGATYYLVKTEKGLAMFEHGQDGSGALFENHWEDADGDHFAAWIYLPGGGNSRHGYEFVVPKDRLQSVSKYVYPWGTYVVQNINGVERPVPADAVAPAATLISIHSGLIRELELREAAKKGDLSKVNTILGETPALVNAKDKSGVTPLKDAAKYGHKDVVEHLLTKGANVNVKDGEGVTPLCSAAANGRTEVAQLLIAKGADVNAQSNTGLSALHYAAVNGHKDVAEILITSGADVNHKDRNAVSILHMAAYRGHKDISILLINKGAAVNVKDGDGDTPLASATKKRHKDVADLIRSRGGK